MATAIFSSVERDRQIYKISFLIGKQTAHPVSLRRITPKSRLYWCKMQTADYLAKANLKNDKLTPTLTLTVKPTCNPISKHEPLKAVAVCSVKCRLQTVIGFYFQRLVFRNEVVDVIGALSNKSGERYQGIWFLSLLVLHSIKHNRLLTNFQRNAP